ncbi:MAG TPA: MaoC family dehydratase [Stellaceae bacterium]|jgi:acyl dehydratase
MIDIHISPGEHAEFSKTIGESDVNLFAGLTGDFAQIHIDAAFASRNGFGQRIAHGVLVLGLLSTTSSMISQRSIERGCKGVPVSLGYDRIRFLKPVLLGDTITARYTVESVDVEKARTRSKIEAVNQRGELCLAGEHIMKWIEPQA